METQTITVELPRVLLEQVQEMATLLQTPVDDLFARTLSSTLPDLQDVPDDMRAELTQMTWLSDTALWEIAQSLMENAQQQELMLLSQQQELNQNQRERLQELRHMYGRVTLRKARAYALLSLRGGKPIIA